MVLTLTFFYPAFMGLGLKRRYLTLFSWNTVTICLSRLLGNVQTSRGTERYTEYFYFFCRASEQPAKTQVTDPNVPIPKSKEESCLIYRHIPSSLSKLFPVIHLILTSPLGDALRQGT